jgi:hypothetical protein
MLLRRLRQGCVVARNDGRWDGVGRHAWRVSGRLRCRRDGRHGCKQQGGERRRRRRHLLLWRT